MEWGEIGSKVFDGDICVLPFEFVEEAADEEEFELVEEELFADVDEGVFEGVGTEFGDNGLGVADDVVDLFEAVDAEAIGEVDLGKLLVAFVEVGFLGLLGVAPTDGLGVGGEGERFLFVHRVM